MKKSLIILTRNEIEGLKSLFDSLPLYAVDEALSIDYQSTDGTKEFLKEKGVRVIDQKKRGRGEAFRLGAEVATGDILVFFSPDGNEDPRDIPKLAGAIEAGADMAVASRFMKGSRNDEDDKLFKWRAWANRAFTMLANVFFKGHMFDTINGYRAIRKDKFLLLHPDAEGFTIEYQMSIRAMKLGFTIAEFPTVEGGRIGGQSTATSIPTGFKALRVLLLEVIIGKKV